MTHPDGPLNHDQKWKVHRLYAASWDPKFIARMLGRDVSEITDALKETNANLAVQDFPGEAA